MQMIPATPYADHSQAERRAFDKLRNAFSDRAEWSLTAYHSMSLNRHDYKRFGEIDFLVCGLPGILVLEVKGGGVACHDGLWEYTDRYGEVSRSREGPFKQAETALHGLMNRLREQLPERIVSQFVVGYGVVFTDCDWTVRGAEWDPHTLADARSFRDFERWLRGLFMYWRSKDRGDAHPDAEALKAVKGFLRPTFEVAVPLREQVRGAEERVAALTEDQMAMVDIVAANPRVLCSGGAGTGKTFLAMELARRWTAEGLNVALACRSPWLRRYLESRFAMPRLTVTVADAIDGNRRRAGVDFFDALIVDEGQDLFDMESLDYLDAAVRGGLGGGRWCVFYDSNNQSGLIGRYDPAAFEYLCSVQPARVPLRTNCRNTRVILEKVQDSLAADMGVRGAGEGPDIRERTVRSKEAVAKALAEEINAIVNQGGVAQADLTILSPTPFAQSSAALLPESLRRQITVLDEYSFRVFPPSGISFAEIKNFKGLENEAVLVIDLPPPARGAEGMASHYVAMSRARALLSLIFLSP